MECGGPQQDIALKTVDIREERTATRMRAKKRGKKRSAREALKVDGRRRGRRSRARSPPAQNNALWKILEEKRADSHRNHIGDSHQARTAQSGCALRESDSGMVVLLSWWKEGRKREGGGQINHMQPFLRLVFHSRATARGEVRPIVMVILLACGGALFTSAGSILLIRELGAHVFSGFNVPTRHSEPNTLPPRLPSSKQDWPALGGWNP